MKPIDAAGRNTNDFVADVLNAVTGGLTVRAALNAAFKAARSLSDKQREHIVAPVFGVAASGRRIAHALGAVGAPVDAPRQLVAWRLLVGRIDIDAARELQPEVEWDAVVAADIQVSSDPDPVRRIGIGASLPDFIAERLAAQYGERAFELARALAERAAIVLRVNTLKTTRDEVMEALVEGQLDPRETPYAPYGIELGIPTNVFRRPEFADGRIEVQDEGSQVVAMLVAPPPKGLVIDACAGAGGKTLAIGAAMKDKGRLIALDVHDRRLDELRRRVRRAGLSNARAILIEEQGPWPAEVELLVGKADRVLVDVPCSGLGALRRKPEARWRLQSGDIERLSVAQEAIARRAMSLCAPGGRLIYATCTMLVEENEQVVERLLADSEFELVTVKEIIGAAKAEPITDPTGTFLKLLPHIHGCDGFFAAVLRKKK